MKVACDHDAGLARGRRLLRIGQYAFLAAFLGPAAGLVVYGWSAVIGWVPPDDRGNTALVATIVALTGMLASSPFAVVGRRLIGRHIHAVAGDTTRRGPDAMRIGPPWPRFQAGFVVAMAVAALVLLPVFRPFGWLWVVAEIAAVLRLVLYVRRGPSTLGASYADLDGSGIGLPLHGVRAPWSSIEYVRTGGGFHVAIRIVGPVATTERYPDRWTDLIVSACATGLDLRIGDWRPERAVWTTRRYLPHRWTH